MGFYDQLKAEEGDEPGNVKQHLTILSHTAESDYNDFRVALRARTVIHSTGTQRSEC